MIRINLAPERGRRRVPGVKFTLPAFHLGWAFGLVYLVALLAIGGTWWALISSKAALTADIERAEKDLAVLTVQIGQETRMKDLATELRRRVEVIDGLTQAQGRPIVLADAFASVLPNDLWITGFEEKSLQLKITGSAFSTTAIADFMANLRASGKFKEVDLVISRRDLARPTPLVTFEVTCRYEG